MPARCQGLSEKEKQALRLIVRGHDAKSSARHLGLSVHTVNERLRDARRKLGVSSSREAARLLLDHEGGPKTRVDEGLGGDQTGTGINPSGGSQSMGVRPVAMIMSGALIVSLGFAAFALVANPADRLQPGPAQLYPAVTPDPAVERTARDWLTLVDEGDWTASFAAAGQAFHTVNTASGWAAASRQARSPLGRAGRRRTLEEREVNAPPAGYRQIAFRSSFAGKDEALEVVTLERESSGWRVVGYTIQ